MSNDLIGVQAQTAYTSGKAAPHVGKHLSAKQAHKVSQDFEAFFLGQMLQPMFANIEAEEPFGGGPGDEIWRSMQVDEIAKVMTRSGGIGLTDSVFQQIMKMQEAQQHG